MAFCAITDQNLEQLTLLVFTRIKQNPAKLLDFQAFAKDIFNELLSKKASPEKAITLLSHLPQIVNEYNADKDNRKKLKELGVSLDKIRDAEDEFDSYETLSKFLGTNQDVNPVVVVSDQQLLNEGKITSYISATSVEMKGDKRYINGKPYSIRVTSIAKAGYNDSVEEQTPALKHGNTVDSLAKDVFNGKEVHPDDYSGITNVALQVLHGKLVQLKQKMEGEGWIFKTGVVVYDKNSKVSGEIDLLGINPKGEAKIFDFKTANQRINDTHLKNDTLTFKSDSIQELGILSKWKQYGTQGALYAKMLEETLNIPVQKSIGIIGINIVYNETSSIDESEIKKVGDITEHNIPYSDMRSEYNNKTMKEIVEEYKKLEQMSLGSVNEIKPTKRQKKNFGKLGGKPLDRLAAIDEVAATHPQMEEEIVWLKSVFGNDVPLKIDTIVNSGVFGKFSLDGITLYKNASQGTVYHEGWHRFSQLFLTPAQKDNLYNSVKDDGIKFTSRDGRKLNTSTSSFLDMEEFLAEQFAKFATNPTSYTYPTGDKGVKNFFQKIWDFLVRYFGGDNKPLSLFQKLYRGKIAEYIPSVNNAYWGNLNQIALNSKGEEIVSDERFPLYERIVSYLIGKSIREAGKSFTAFKESKKLQNAVMNEVHDELADRYNNDDNLTDEQFGELENILNNWYDFVKSYLSASSYDTLKDFTIEDSVLTMSSDEVSALEDLRDTYSDVDDINEENDDSRPDRFDRTGNEDSAMGLADSSIHDFFRTIPKVKNIASDGSFTYELNELGYPENHKYYDIFYKTKKILSGSFKLQEMLDRMSDPHNQRIFPELGLVNNFVQSYINNLGKDPNHYRNVQNVTFLQSFYHVMNMPEVANMQVTVNFLPLTRNYTTFRPTIVSYRRASRNLSLKIIKTWEKNFKDARGKNVITYANYQAERSKMANSPLYTTDDGKVMLNPFVDFAKLYPNNLRGIQNFFSVIGVELNPKVYEDPASVDKLRKYKAKIIQTLEIYKNSESEPFMINAEQLVALQNESSTLQEMETNKFLHPSDYLSTLDSLYANELARLYFIDNPIQKFAEKREYTTNRVLSGKVIPSKQTTDALKFVWEEIAEIEELFGERVSSGAFRIEDKTKYPYYLPNSLITMTEMLNQINNISDFHNESYISHLDPIEHKWMKRSYFLNKLFDSDGNRAINREGNPIKVVLEDIASLRTISDEGIVEKHPRSLTKDEKFFMDVVTLFKNGAIETPRAETSSTVFSVRLSDYGGGRVLPISFSDVVGKAGLPENFHEIIRNYFLSEVEKRQWYIQNEPDNKLSKKFNVFEDILSPEFKSKIVDDMMKKENLANADLLLANPATLTSFRKEMEIYFTNLSNDIHERFKNLPDTHKDAIKDTLQSKNVQSLISVAKTFTLNYFVLNSEFYNLFFGDLYYYKNPFKRGKFATNTGNSYYIDNYRNEMLNSVQKDTLHSILTGESTQGKDFKNFKTAILNDVEMKSAYLHEDDNQNILLRDILNMRIASGTLSPSSSNYSDEVNNIKKSLDKYSKINIADGQGIIGLDFYRNFSIITNIWSEEKEREYERQLAAFRNNYNLYYDLDENGKKVAMDVDKERDARDKDKELLNSRPFAIFNPLKISYTGPQVKDGPMRPVFDKFSVRPIIPEAAIGKRDENLLLEMSKKDLDYVKFQSGTKVYQDKSVDWFKKLGEGKYDLGDFKVEIDDSQELYSAYLKHQLSTEGIKNESIFGSQFRKIIFGVKYSPLVRDNQKLLNYFSDLEKQAFDAVNDLLSVEENDLFSLLGIEKNGDDYQVHDFKKFIQLLQDESIKRGVAVNNIDYLQYDENTKKAKYPIDYAFNRQQIQDLLAGLIDDKLRRLKLNGSSLIQVSSAGYETKSIYAENKKAFSNPTTADIHKYGTTGLHYYHIEYDKDGNPVRTSTMGVKVALIGQYRNLLRLEAPESIGGGTIEVKGDYKLSLKRLNDAMKDSEWKEKHMEKFLMVGYRIPTQNNNFLDRMEVMEFLPESAGAIIIPPIELIIKSGSDFDIDKMSIIKPAINGNGDVVSSPKENVNDIYKHIRESIYEEREAKSIERELKNILNQADIDKDELHNIQRKVRLTILDLMMKADVNDSIIDAIMNNIQNNEKVIIPENAIPEEQAFPDEDMRNFDFELFKAVIDYARVDNEIELIKAQYKIVNKEKHSLNMSWFNKKRQYKNAKNNDLLSIFNKTLSHPTYFEMLVTPSSASMIEGFANDLIAAQQNMSPTQKDKALSENEGKLFDSVNTPEKNSRYQTNNKMFDDYLGKRKDLGGYAIQRTFTDIFNFINFSISKEYHNPKGESKIIFTPLIPMEDRTKMVRNGKIEMHGDSVTNIPIKDTFDQLISATVDLAGSPFYPYLNINTYNKKHFQYMIHQKVDPKTAIWMLSQPVLVDLYNLYEDKRRKIQGYSLKHAIVEMALVMRALDNPPKFEGSDMRKYSVLEGKWQSAVKDEDGETIEDGMYVFNKNKANSFLSRPYMDLHKNLAENDYFSFEDLDNAIRNTDMAKPIRERMASYSKSDLQKKILSYFASMTEEADALMKLQFANNVDTTKYATLTSLIRNKDNKREIRQSDMFDKNQLDKLEKESMIAPFDYTTKALLIQKSLFPSLYSNQTIGTFAALIDNVLGAKNLQIERISKIIENDYIEFVYKNFGQFQGHQFSDYFEPLLINIDGAQNHYYISNRLGDIKNKYPELNDLPFVEALSEDAYFPPFDPIKESYRDLDNKEIRNIFFLRNPDNPPFEKNIFTNNWRNLINFDPIKLGLSGTYSEDEVKEISEFFNDLVYFSLYQSGLTNTGNGFSDLVPYELWASFVQDAFARMKDELGKNKSLLPKLLEVFQIRFKQMNPKVNWKNKYVTTGEFDSEGNEIRAEIPFYKNYYRGKDYKVTDDDLGFVSHLYTDEELGDDQKNVPTDKSTIEHPFEIGRYVKYGDDIYIITKPLKKDKMWQIYNPRKQGTSAKLSVNERNLIALADKGSLVNYGLKTYMVTAKEEIIDLDNNKIVNWSKDFPARATIIQLSKGKNFPGGSLDIKNQKCL